MPASEREPQSRPSPMPRVSMKDLLASCAAASAVSTPPAPPVVPDTAPALSEDEDRAA